MKRKVYTLPVIDGQTVLVASREITFDQDARPDNVGIGEFIGPRDWDSSYPVRYWSSPLDSWKPIRVFRAHKVTFHPNPHLLPANAPTMIVWERIE